MKSQPRPGLTIYDLLLVLALLAILVALFFPLILRARQSANRIHSINNLKQLALAAHTYHDTNNHMPPGVDQHGFSANAHLLDYLEEANTAKLLDFNKPVSDKANDRARAVAIKLFISPMDPAKTVHENVGATNYLWCAGSLPALADNNGVCCLNSQVTLGAITNANGCSRTVLVGETLKGDANPKGDVHRQHVLHKIEVPPAPVQKADPKRIAELIADLQNDRAATRQKAEDELEKIGDAATTALRKALEDKPTVDFRQRVERIMQRPLVERAKKQRESLNALKEDVGVKDFKDGKNIASNRCSSWLDGRFLQGTFTGTRLPDDSRPDVDCDGEGGLSALRSLDGRVIPMAFADGHVQTIPVKIDGKVWKMMMNWKNTDAFQLP